MANDDDFEDSVFDNVDEAELAELERPTKRRMISEGLQDSREDDVFDDLDEADLAELEPELERPTKRLRTSAEVPNTQGHLALAERILKEQFGYPSFRHEQAGAIQSILAGDNTLVIFPTGAGKSLCYQIPAIAFPDLDKVHGRREPSTAGVTLVVSPLIALMKDQVDALKKRGIPAESIDSSKSWEDIQRIYASLRESKLRILYCAPERLNNEGFVATVGDIPGGVRLLAVDEAHCVSEWGYSFRPEYLKVARFADEVKAERVICLTATATPNVIKDICKAFRVKESCVFKTSVYRPNLELHAKSISAGPGSAEHWMKLMLGISVAGIKTESDKRFEELFSFLRNHPGPTLVYVALQQQAETHARVLKDHGFNAAAFHAGMKTEDKRLVQDDFMSGKIQIVCATIAFGMGIDKPDIRNVVHWDLANTVEEYSQQIGRAGRDGKKSYCMFYLAPSAFYLRQVFARGNLPSRQSLKGLLMNILDQARGLGVSQVFKVSHYQQEREYDIRASPLSIIYATLELRFGFFRAITPEYTTYKFEAMKSYYSTLNNDRSKEAKAILSGAKKKLKLYDIDVHAAAREAGLIRDDIVKKLNQLNERGHIKLQTRGLEHRYMILKELPKTEPAIEAVVDKIYAQLQTRETDALNRGREVMDLITGNRCFARALAEHFGMGLPGDKPSCGHCTYCFTRRPVKPPTQPREGTSAASIQRVLQATKVRDDPRFLARVAYGIKSPRVTQLKLDKSPVFRSLAHHYFEDLLREFTKACDAAGATKREA